MTRVMQGMHTIPERLAEAYPKGKVTQLKKNIRLTMGNAVISQTPGQWAHILRIVDKIKGNGRVS